MGATKCKATDGCEMAASQSPTLTCQPENDSNGGGGDGSGNNNGSGGGQGGGANCGSVMKEDDCKLQKTEGGKTLCKWEGEQCQDYDFCAEAKKEPGCKDLSADGCEWAEVMGVGECKKKDDSGGGFPGGKLTKRARPSDLVHATGALCFVWVKFIDPVSLDVITGAAGSVTW